MIGQGFTDRFLTVGETRDIVFAGLDALRPDGKRLLFIIPDGTRTMPMPGMFTMFREALAGRATQVDFLVALGTHQPMSDEALSRLVGEPVVEGRAGASRIFNHEWQDPATFATVGEIPADEIAALSGGRMSQSVTVSLNRRIFDYDQIVICGPVFPHEVVGFSGGNKYFFPGIAGAEIINFTHWLGALITNYEVIGAGYTPVRAVIDRAASLVTVPTACFALVVTPDGLAGLYYGSAREAWERASALSAQRHIVWLERPVKRVLSVMPPMYADLWTAGKGMYKIEPAVADGGEVVIYAPHIREVSFTHGHLIDAIGYHCRDYFTSQPERFAKYPGGVLAHSTHVKGLGTYDPATGIETPRVTVTLATGIPEERCRRINLGYRDPATIVAAEWQGREAEGILHVPRAGEMLYRVRPSAPAAAPRQSATVAM
ncbi:MAG TPA: lactate racemase domain-containing protein [Casimicrobiaceae bacterium]|nr:lactate racemase domain-containing protein [Casimicrobiaceae bacterium]